jgi:hypothetical protein
MNEYKATIKNRLIILVMCTVLSVAVVLSGVLLAGKAELDNGSFTDGLVKGFPMGLFAGFCVLMLFNMVRCMRALSKESVLKEMYISDNDERKKMIRQSAMGKSFFLTVGILAVGITVASFYNNIVTVTLTAVLFIHVLIGVILKLYYSQKY